MPSALITGGASGIGRAIAERLAAAAYRVVVADVNVARGEQFVAEWRRQHAERSADMHFIRTDVSREADVAGVVRQTVDTFGRIDCMINNAGVGGAFGPVTEIDVDDWDYTFGVLVRSVFVGTKHAARAMKAQTTGGVIVNIASIAGLSGGVGALAYSAAKAAVINFGRVVAVELAPSRIRVNTVSPGVVRTALVESGKRDFAAAMASVQPWPALGEPDHVARVVEFLCGDGAEFITGENVVVDGGLMAAGPRVDQLIGSNPTGTGRTGVNRGSTGERHTVRDITPLK